MASEALVEHCLELLAPLGAVSARRMFGGHGLRVDGLFFGLIAFDRLYLKTNAETRPAFEAAGCQPFVYDGKGKPVTVSYWTVPAEAMESPALMRPWARLALQAALAAPPKVRRPTAGRSTERSTKQSAELPAKKAARKGAAKPIKRR